MNGILQSPALHPAPGNRRGLAADYIAIRGQSLALAAPLTPEDAQVQSMDDVSPTKWHLAHTSWFFETFLLVPHLPGYRVFDPAYAYLFNSYYEAVGPRHPRPARGLLTRPPLEEVGRYRAHVDAAMTELLARADAVPDGLVRLGLQHEQQHQELILMDIQHVLSCNPLRPAYAPAPPRPAAEHADGGWISCPGGLVEIGAAEASFAFDNEAPRHKVWLEPFRIADRLVTVGEWREFIADGGYGRPELWLSDGWARVRAEGWQGPLYWKDAERHFTLHGEEPLDPLAPVCHVSFYEADAFARWRGARLPTEAEWEIAATAFPAAEDEPLRLHPVPARPGDGGMRQAFGALWQWTASAYAPYPGYRAAGGALGEYNGKFMSGQMVLRGSACVTPPGHGRPTYRNFFPPGARWAFSGVRLADAS